MKIKVRKRLSTPDLLEGIRVRLSRIKDPLAGKTNYPLADCLMSALAMFGLKYRPLLQFEESHRVDKKVQHNLKTLYGVEHVASDTYIRERLDLVEPTKLQAAFKACFSAVQRGKQLPLYQFLDEYYLVSSDGTGFFYSDSVHCDNCCVKNHKSWFFTFYMDSGGRLFPANRYVLIHKFYHSERESLHFFFNI